MRRTLDDGYELDDDPRRVDLDPPDERYMERPTRARTS